MISPVSDVSAQALVRSIPLMERHRGRLAAGLERYAARCGPPDSSAGLHRVGPRVMLDMLFDHARETTGARPLVRLAETARRHRALGLTAAHYSCFGDGFGAVVRDVLGAEATPALVAAWSDAYWAIVRAVSRQGVRAAA